MARIWSTPQSVFDKLHSEFRFTVDVCADRDNAKCSHFLDRSVAIDRDWVGTCWLNPPYGNEISGWLRKAWESANRGAIVVALVPGRTNAPWWHNYIMQAAEIRFVRKKLSFEADDGKKGVPGWGAVIAVFRKGGGPPNVSSWDQP